MEVIVTRKGKVTIPAELRRKYQIVEGIKLTVEDSPAGIVFKVIPKIEDLAGIDAGKITTKEALEIINKMRSEILLKPIKSIWDMAGTYSRFGTPEEIKKELDKLREEDE